jgi:hypothetical protein
MEIDFVTHMLEFVSSKHHHHQYVGKTPPPRAETPTEPVREDNRLDYARVYMYT